jgi:signal transduction histidine kinase
MVAERRRPSTSLVAVLAAGTLLALLGVNLDTLSRLSSARRWAIRSRDVDNALVKVRMDLTDAETGQRGFLLTGTSRYLEPLEAANRLLATDLDEARKLIPDSPKEQTWVAELDRLVSQKIAELHETIALREQGNMEAAMVIVQSGEGNAVMDRARSLIADLRDAEQRRLEDRRAEMTHYLTTATWVDVGAGICLLMLGVILFLIRRDIARREVLEKALRDAASFQQQFIGILGHDLRNPLSAISLSTGTLQRREHLTPSQSETIGRIAASAARMGRMVDQLLDLTRAQIGGGIVINPRPETNLAQVLGAAVDELRTAYPECEIRQQTIGNTMGAWDPDRLAQVVSNLVGNAVQHGVPPVDVIVTGDNLAVTIEIRNAGSAIPTELIPLLFDPFRRGSARGRNQNGKSAGLGLGLFICKMVVAAHGGTIDLRSAPEVGTTVRVTLPRLVDDNRRNMVNVSPSA